MAMRSSSRSGSDLLVIAGIVLGAAAWAVALVAAAQPDDRQRFTMGVLRRDGLLLPFASFDGGDWSVPWPASLKETALPIALGDVPRKWWGAAGPGAKWTAWLADGDARPLTLVKPVPYPVFCTSRLAVATDYRGGPFPLKEPTVPKDGLAIAGNAKLLPIDNVSVKSSDAARVLGLITKDFNEEEAQAASHFTRWKHPFAAAQREKVPIEIEAYYRASEKTSRGAWTTSYVEAVRSFPAGPKDKGCGLITFAQAWIREQPGEPPSVDLGARITYCDRADAAFVQPFGRLHVRDEVYWVYQTSSWTDELYTVARMTPKDVKPVLVVSGGFCAR